jgi:predicted butyrate kinase (DUF1464 family)
LPRVIGVDPGTVSIDLCGLDGSSVFLDQSLPTGEAVANPQAIVSMVTEAMPLDLVAGPSGYGLPLIDARDATEDDLRLAFLPDEDDSGGILGLRRLVRALAQCPFRVVLTPGVIHLRSVPHHRKLNRVDIGTADKVCAAALALNEYARRHSCHPGDASFILLELGGAFTAAVAVERGRIDDGLGGTSGPLGIRASGALDGEVAFLAGTISKRLLFGGGAASIAGVDEMDIESFAV